METAEVVSSTIKGTTDDDAKEVNPLSAERLKQNNCQNESSPSSADSNTIMESKIVTSNKTGASRKLFIENKITTKNTPSASPDANDCQYFFEDEVFRIDKKGQLKFGWVMQTSSGDNYEDTLTNGKVSVVWYPKGNETVVSENSIGLVDRTLMPGDIVKTMLPGKKPQQGYCRDINTSADVKIQGTNYVIKNVNAERLTSLVEWQSDSAVCLDSWVGSIEAVEKKATLRSTNGCLIELSSNSFHYFDNHNNNMFSPHVFYPGNAIVGKLPHMSDVKVLTPEIPFKIYKRGKPIFKKFIVESVYTDSITVHWQCKGISNDTNLRSASVQPNSRVSGDDLKRLKRLNLFESCMLQISDHNLLIYSPFDTITKKSHWYAEKYLQYEPLLGTKKEEIKKPNVPSVDSPAVNGETNGTPNHVHAKWKKKQILSIMEEKSSTNKLKRIHTVKIDRFGGSSHYKENNKTRCYSATKRLENGEEENEWKSADEEDAGEYNTIADNDNKTLNTDQLLSPKSPKDLNKCEDYADIATPTTMSTCSSPSVRTSPKSLNKQQIKKITAGNLKSHAQPKPQVGDELVTEAMLVYSTATVVWQDGTVEYNIPSTQLYPIHHLDKHEFFPGDFVVSDVEESENASYRDYGVVQNVDHQGRTALVKWYSTYVSADVAKPTYKKTTEVSAYDLKDHPDFQYRPGTMVIRVANFVGEDANCTGGQIIDNCVDGRVKVWWVDGHISLCWPQDLFEVGHYNQDDWGYESDDSWETVSEDSEYGVGSLCPKLLNTESQLLTNIEKARSSLARLEEIFNLSPNLQNSEVMRQLLAIYKACRYLDRLIGSNFFNEDNFEGLVERVRCVGLLANESPHTRLSNEGVENIPSATSLKNESQNYQYTAIVAVNNSGHNMVPQSMQHLQTVAGQSPKEYAPKVLFNISSTPFKCSGNHYTANSSIASANTKRRISPAAAARQSPIKKTEDVQIEDNYNKASNCDITPTKTVEAAVNNFIVPHFDITPNKCIQYNMEKHQLLSSAKLNLETAFAKSSEDDSGNFSRNIFCDCSSTSCTSSSDLTTTDTNNSITNKTNDNRKSVSCGSMEMPEDSAPEYVCARLCTLLKEQLVHYIDEVRERFYIKDESNLSDNNVDKEKLEEEKSMETVIDIETSNNDETNENLNSNCKGELEEHVLKTAKAEVISNGEDVASIISLRGEAYECFRILSTAPKSHKYYGSSFIPNNRQQFYKAVQKEHRMLKSSLPPGVWVRSFEDRMDLLSVMMEGPKNTPYEDGMFFFDIQLGRQYPKEPPLCHYISFCSDRLNPNLYEDGKVCVSLLGTWVGRGTEVWGPRSSLLQVLVSIQGLILVPEPYFNEAGYEKQKGTQQGKENSRMYNEMVLIKMVQATTKLISKPVEIFRDEILIYYSKHGLKMYERIKGWLESSKESHGTLMENKDVEQDADKSSNNSCPEFPLVPASRGFCLTLAGPLEQLKQKLSTLENVSTDITNM